MIQLRTKYFGILCLLILPLTHAFSQNIIVVQSRKAHPGKMQEYIHRENTYWKEVAKKAIADDKLTAWSIWQRVGGFDLHENHDILVVNTYTPEQFAKDENIWDFKKVFPDADPKDVRTNGITTTHDVLYYRNLASYVISMPNYIRVNFADAKNPREYARMEPEVYGPFIDKQMKAGNTKSVSWTFSTLVNPRGRDVSHDAVSVDGFNTLIDALGSNLKTNVDRPKGMDELMASHDKAMVEIYRLVATSAE